MFSTEIRVKEALACALNYSGIDTIEMKHHLKKDLQLDSMSSLMFLMKLEENISGFIVDPDTLQMKDLETVSSVVQYVNLQMLTKEHHVH